MAKVVDVSPRARVNLIVAAAGLSAAGAVVGVTLAQTSGSTHVTAAKPPAGAPPLALDLGVRTDPQARALARAAALYAKHDRAAAARIFLRYESLPAQIGLAFSRWPDGSLDRMKELVAAHPRSSLAELHLGLARFWSGRRPDAFAAFRRAVSVGPDTPSAVRADGILHPSFPAGLPQFVPSFPTPAAILRLPPAAQVVALRRLARTSVRGKLLYGVALQRLEHPLSAEREFAAAARLAPDDPDAQVAAAVGRFTKAAPRRAFSQLGPLVLRFPRAATVRFHLGLLLLWLRQVPQARIELRKAVADSPRSELAREAKALLASLRNVGTK